MIPDVLTRPVVGRRLVAVPSFLPLRMSSLSPSCRRSLAVVFCTTAVVWMPARVDAQESKRLAMNASVERLRDSVVSFAKKQLGKRYQLGGSTPTQGFDCSGLVKYVMSAFKLELPRTAMDQAREGLAVKKDTSRLLPGDLLTFGTTKMSPVSHVGIYVGDGRYIHASSVAGRVIESPIDRQPAPLVRVWSGARRMLVERKRPAQAAPATTLPTNAPASPKGEAS